MVVVWFFIFFSYCFQDFPEGRDESSGNYINPIDPLSPPCYPSMAPPFSQSPDAYMHSGKRYPRTPVPSPPPTPHGTFSPPLSCPIYPGSLTRKPHPPRLSSSPPHAEDPPTDAENNLHHHSLPRWARLMMDKCQGWCLIMRLCIVSFINIGTLGSQKNVFTFYFVQKKYIYSYFTFLLHLGDEKQEVVQPWRNTQAKLTQLFNTMGEFWVARLSIFRFLKNYLWAKYFHCNLSMYLPRVPIIVEVPLCGAVCDKLEFKLVQNQFYCFKIFKIFR